ncbi:hypothetical protein DS843_30220 [Roseomonas genomospecies 6]|uniref:Uncharacterized protein n=1 Tax=Roseomonas genomospecies 6 TaxID=214106 RepID=A0A9W7KMS7_9PROT|nr:hypothetical protein DS843_30220 [Roseomonas genomospecies 6]
MVEFQFELDLVLSVATVIQKFALVNEGINFFRNLGPIRMIRVDDPDKSIKTGISSCIQNGLGSILDIRSLVAQRNVKKKNAAIFFANAIAINFF